MTPDPAKRVGGYHGVEVALQRLKKWSIPELGGTLDLPDNLNSNFAKKFHNLTRIP